MDKIRNYFIESIKKKKQIMSKKPKIPQSS